MVKSRHKKVICFAMLWLSALFNISVFNISVAHAKPNCAKNYKSALSGLYQRYSAPLKYAVSVSHNKVDIFPKRWMVAPAIALGDPQKRLSKKARRRSKAGLILTPLKNAHFSALQYTAQEKQILTLADSIVRWRGKDPAFNKRGRYGWLTSRIAADLRVYMGQPDHPALCTGANLMMNHLYDNSGRFRKRVAFIKKLAPLAHQYAAARYRAFKYSMETTQNPRFVKLGRLETDVSLSLLMTKITKLFHNRTFSTRVDKESQFLASLTLIKKETGLATKPSTKPSHQHLLTRLTLPSPKPLKRQSAAPRTTIKTIGINQPTSTRYSALPSKQGFSLSSLQKASLRKSLSAIEAAYYIDHIAHGYEALNSALFGAIFDIRQAHKTHCHCAS